MLGDISVADEIYIVCGYTDMRRSIDGLCAIVQADSIWIPDSGHCTFSVANVVADSKRCFGKGMVFFSFTSGWRPNAGRILEMDLTTVPKERNPFWEGGELCPKSQR